MNWIPPRRFDIGPAALGRWDWQGRERAEEGDQVVDFAGIQRRLVANEAVVGNLQIIHIAEISGVAARLVDVDHELSAVQRRQIVEFGGVAVRGNRIELFGIGIAADIKSDRLEQ